MRVDLVDSETKQVGATEDDSGPTCEMSLREADGLLWQLLSVMSPYEVITMVQVRFALHTQILDQPCTYATYTTHYLPWTRHCIIMAEDTMV